MAEEMVSTADMTKVSLAAMFGSMTEVFDYVVAGPIAVLVWPHIFFPSISPTASLIFSLATYIVTFVSRPFGAALFGHFGDKLGRKNTLVWTLLTMGIGTIAIILLPGFDRIGILAVVILVIARIVIGLGFGGEWGSATTWVIEHAAKRKRRGFWTSVVTEGYAIGGMLAGLSITIILATVGFGNFVSFWWRIPFVVSLLVLVIGAIVRFTLSESKIFKEIFEKKETKRRPSLEVLRKMPKTVLRVSLVSLVPQTPFYVGTTVMVSYMEHTVGTAASFATGTIIYGEILAAILALVIGLTTDKLGRRRIMLILSALVGILSIPYAYLMTTGVEMNMLIGQIFLLGLTVASLSGLSAFMPESFPPEYRASGTGYAYQFGILIGVLPESFLALYLLKYGTMAPWYILPIMIVPMIVAFIATLYSKESKSVSLEEKASSSGGR